jgi:hypothetical protein
LLQTPARLKQPIAAVRGDGRRSRSRCASSARRALAHPGTAALRTRHELLWIELNAHRGAVGGGPLGRIAAFALQALLGLAQRLAPTLARAQMLG